MEKYDDLITNGLDLVSFLLVTPEIVRLIAPAVRQVVWAVSTFLLGFVTSLPLVFLLKHSDWFGWKLSYRTGLDVFAIGMVLIVLALYSIKGFNVLDLVTDRVSKHFLVLGVVLFFTSRLIAFYGSAVKAGFL